MFDLAGCQDSSVRNWNSLVWWHPSSSRQRQKKLCSHSSADQRKGTLYHCLVSSHAVHNKNSNHLNTGRLNIENIQNLDFKVLVFWMVNISSVFRCHLTWEYQTICQLDNFGPFEHQTIPVFVQPLYVFKWPGFSYGYSYSPNHSKTEPFEIQTFLSRFQMGLDKMAAICLDFEWLGFQISDPIWNSDQLQSNLFLTIWNPD